MTRRRQVPARHDGPKEPLSAAQQERLNIRERCKLEANGKCQRCGSIKGSKLLSLPLCFQLVCSKCLGRHAVSNRVAKAEARKLQTTLFSEGS